MLHRYTPRLLVMILRLNSAYYAYIEKILEDRDSVLHADVEHRQWGH